MHSIHYHSKTMPWCNSVCEWNDRNFNLYSIGWCIDRSSHCHFRYGAFSIQENVTSSSLSHAIPHGVITTVLLRIQIHVFLMLREVQQCYMYIYVFTFFSQFNFFLNYNPFSRCFSLNCPVKTKQSDEDYANIRIHQ